VAARDAQIQKLKEAESIGRREKLVLPTAQVGERELEEIVKIGQAGENAKALVDGGSEASGRLLSDYEGFESARMVRTPRTAPQGESLPCYEMPSFNIGIEDNILLEARNLRNMTMAQTPLLGEENTPFHSSADSGTGFEGATPRHQVAFTPNPLAEVSATPRDAATPLRTPLRDNLAINSERASIPSTSREQKMHISSAKRALQLGFANLPKPENNFELIVPEVDEDQQESAAALAEEDAAERDARIKRLQEQEERKALARRSQVVQRSLPRPANVDAEELLKRLSLMDDDTDTPSPSSRRLINEEFVRLINHDAITHPLPGTTLPGATLSTYEPPLDEDMEAARDLVHLELATAVGFQNTTPEQLREGLQAIAKVNTSEESESTTWDSLRQTLVFDPTVKSWVDFDSLSLDQRVDGYTSVLAEKREQMTKEANKAAKVEKKLGVTLGGYQARSQALSKRIVDAFEDLEKTFTEQGSFARLRAMESIAGPRRVESLKEEVGVLERRERTLQERYGELESEKREAESRIAALEEKVMAEAEALNEAHLAGIEEAD
jgi:pre-mRNA-splicing factor CDC5/CEF1